MGGGGDCLKRGAGTVCKFKGGLAKNEGVGLMGFDTLIHTMSMQLGFLNDLKHVLSPIIFHALW